LILISYIFSIWDQNKSLTQLDLSHNYLRAVTSDLVDGLPSLESLDLTDNDISLVESGALTNLPKLIHLSLTGKSIANLYYILYSAAFSPHPIHPDSWGFVEDIRRLSFSSAGLTSIINISNKGNSIYISQQATFSLPAGPLFLCGGRKDSLARLLGAGSVFPTV
jgi:Leucine-rich repeat (LRR) protein